MTYQLAQYGQILRLIDNAFIPFDPANTDYQAYQAWLAEGNTPIPADEPPAADPADEPTLEDKLASIGLTLNDLKEALR